MIQKIKNLIQYLSRFYYYGKIGADKCFPYDSSCINELTYAHLKKVKEFMHSDNTHLMWNSSGTTNLMKKLNELTELSRRMCEPSDTKYSSEVINRYKYLYGVKDFFTINFPNDNIKKRYSSELRRAFKRDDLIKKQTEDRYYYLMKKYLQHFWD